jgi:hypothetical protein
MLALIGSLLLLGVLRYKPWRWLPGSKPGTENAESVRRQLAVGFLPVT